MSQTGTRADRRRHFHSPQDRGRGHVLPWRRGCWTRGAPGWMGRRRAETLRRADLSALISVSSFVLFPLPSSLPPFLSVTRHLKARRGWVDESSGLHSSSVLCVSLWCNGVSAGIPLSPIFLCKYIPDQWTTECSAPLAAAAEGALSTD